ncbi:hypothetical protein [Saccharopolyspora sp. 6M]|uniref:hypothetical protein n=1 Tax=Saccharopolyspora sp. 6M TaxID=2877237 RepID=UPI001CD23E39|nr:hypothetical protein [Saccharopolyspora sp. 6M]MCA1229654.1 hypothetical protein [Saccharopolyspora sp. 6M]
MINFLVALALCYVLIKIPFWVLSSIKGRGSSLIGGLVRGVIAYKTFGLLGGGGGGGRSAPKRPKTTAPDSADPYAKARTDSRGQYVMPFDGIKRSKPPKPAYQKYAPKQRSTPRSRRGPDRQLMLPWGGEWPENKPVLEPDGQYRLPMRTQRQPRPKQPAQPPPPKPGRSRQMRFPADGEWPENRPREGADGQYRLPISVRRQARPASPPVPPETKAGHSEQIALPLGRDWPENRPRAGRDGQYRLPLNVRRQPPPHPVRPVDPPPQAPRRAAHQLPLPLKPPPRRPRRPRSSGGPS